MLDDFEQAQSRALADSLDLFLRARQQRLRFLIASRHDPSVALQRLRLEGRLTELRATDLVMTPEESRELLASAGVSLTDEDADVLHERTEGWVAGLSLAALSLRDHPDPTKFVRTFAGDERPVGDYLIEEVLQRQPSQLRDFLLRTSVVDVLEPGLTEELTGRPDGMHTLEQLRRSNAFLVPHPRARAALPATTRCSRNCCAVNCVTRPPRPTRWSIDGQRAGSRARDGPPRPSGMRWPPAIRRWRRPWSPNSGSP